MKCERIQRLDRVYLVACVEGGRTREVSMTDNTPEVVASAELNGCRTYPPRHFRLNLKSINHCYQCPITSLIK